MIFAQYLSYLIIAILILYLIGELMFKVFNIKLPVAEFYTVFFKLLLGSIFVVVVGSIFITKGKTVFLLMIPFVPLAYFYVGRDNPITSLNKIYKREVFLFLKLLIPLLLIFIIRFGAVYAGNEQWHTTHSDYVAYSKLSWLLMQYGVENYNSPPVFIDAQLAPYHYFELWLNGFLASLFTTPHLITLMVVTFSILSFITFLGICALMELTGVEKTWAMVYAFIFTFLTGIYIPDLYQKHPFFTNMAVFARNIWNYPKLTVIYIFLIASGLGFYLKKSILGYLFLIILPIFYISVLPAIMMAVGLQAVVLFIQKNRKEAFQILGALALFFTTFMVFYVVWGNMLSIDKSTNVSTFNLQSIKTKINIIGGTSLQILILYAPFLFLTIYFRKLIWNFIKLNSYGLLAVFLPFFGLISWAILSTMADSVQLFSNVAIPLINILLAIFITLFINHLRKRIIIAFVSVIVFLNLYLNRGEVFPRHKTIDSKELEKIVNKVKNKNHLSVALKNTTDYESLFAKNTNLSFSGQYLVAFYSDAYSVDISVHKMKIDSASAYMSAEIKMLKNAPFYKYVEQQKLKNEFQNIQQSQLDFIKEYKIEYLIAHKQIIIPQHIQQLVEEETYYKEDKILFFKK